MPYFPIGEHVALLTESQWDEFTAKFAEERNDLSFAFRSKIHNSKENKELLNLVDNYLKEQYKKSPEKFYDDYVRFHFTGELAKGMNVYTVLSSYCQFHGYCVLREMKDSEQSLTDMFLTDGLTWETSRYLCISHFIKPQKWWWRFRYNMKGRVFNFTIDTQSITEIKGDLSKFFITTEKNIMIFTTDEILFLERNT